MAKNILVIDDDKMVLLTLKRLLAKEGYRVSTALSGLEALELIEGTDYDLIISDLKMPAMDGVETVKKIRGFLSQNNKKLVPEIFITGYAKEEIYNNALALNAAGYIDKPFDIKPLLQTIKEAVRGI